MPSSLPPFSLRPLISRGEVDGVKIYKVPPWMAIKLTAMQKPHRWVERGLTRNSTSRYLMTASDKRNKKAASSHVSSWIKDFRGSHMSVHDSRRNQNNSDISCWFLGIVYSILCEIPSQLNVCIHGVFVPRNDFIWAFHLLNKWWSDEEASYENLKTPLRSPDVTSSKTAAAATMNHSSAPTATCFSHELFNSIWKSSIT